MLLAIDRLIHVLENVSNFHQGYVSNAYPCLHIVKEQIFISSVKHTPGAYHPKICWVLLTSDRRYIPRTLSSWVSPNSDTYQCILHLIVHSPRMKFLRDAYFSIPPAHFAARNDKALKAKRLFVASAEKYHLIYINTTLFFVFKSYKLSKLSFARY